MDQKLSEIVDFKTGPLAATDRIYMIEDQGAEASFLAKGMRAAELWKGGAAPVDSIEHTDFHAFKDAILSGANANHLNFVPFTVNGGFVALANPGGLYDLHVQRHLMLEENEKQRRNLEQQGNELQMKIEQLDKNLKVDHE